MKPGQHFIRRKQQRLHDTKSNKDLLFLVALYLKHSSKQCIEVLKKQILK